MNDIAGVSAIIGTVLATTYWHIRTLDRFRVEMLGSISDLRSDMLTGTNSFRSTVTGKLNAIQQDMRDLRISYLEQHWK